MIEIKSLLGDWKEVTREVAENFYKAFDVNATAIRWQDKLKYFNENHIRGGHVMLNGRVETDEEMKERIFQYYKNDLIKLNDKCGQLRFNCIEYVCNTPNINPYEMAVSLVKDGTEIVYDDSSISKEANKVKERKVQQLLAKERY